MRRAAALLALVAVAGCSVVFVDGPPDPPTPSEKPRCTTSRTLPVLDLTGAIAGFVASIIVLTTADCIDCREADREEGATNGGALLITTGSVMLAYGSSGITGLMRTSDCRNAHAQHRAFKRY